MITIEFYANGFYSPRIYQYKSNNKLQTISEIRSLSPSNWTLTESPNFGRDGVYGWVKFDINNQKKDALYLELVGHFKEVICVWIYNKDSLMFNKTLVTRDLRKENPILHRYFLYNLPQKEKLSVYIKAYNFPGDALKFPIRIWKVQDFVDANQFDIWYWAIFAGLMIMSIVISLFNYLFHPQKIYLYYAGYLFCFGMYTFLNDGWGVLLPETLGFLDDLISITYWINFGLLFFIYFSQKFLDIDLSKLPKWTVAKLSPLWGLVGMLFFLITAHLAKANNSPYYFDVFVKGGFLSVLIYIAIWIAYVIDALKRNFKPVWLHILSGSVMLIINAIFYFLINSGLLKIAISEMGIFRIALVTDIIVILISWLYRQKIILENQKFLEVENKNQQNAIYEQTIKELQHQTALQLQRERLARDLHDGIGSQLSHIIGQIDLLAQKENNQNKLISLGEFTRETNQTLRDTIWILNREAISWLEFKQRLIGYIARVCDNIDTPLVSYSFNLPDSVYFSPQLTSYLFHILQESLNNALKYAEAQLIQITIYQKDGNLLLFFDDNGNGFDTSLPCTGYGLNNINKRIEELKGNLIINSSSKGTNIEISIPYMANIN